jgi:hypothetical protein
MIGRKQSVEYSLNSLWKILERNEETRHQYSNAQQINQKAANQICDRQSMKEESEVIGSDIWKERYQQQSRANSN